MKFFFESSNVFPIFRMQFVLVNKQFARLSHEIRLLLVDPLLQNFCMLFGLKFSTLPEAMHGIGQA
jgi:hypothetical protein